MLQLDLGGSAAQSVVLMAIVMALTVVQFRFVERRVRTDGREPPARHHPRHAVLVLGVVVVAFPIYVAFTASTQTLPAVEYMPLLPGSEAVANYRTALTAGTRRLSGTPVGLLLFNNIVWR